MDKGKGIKADSKIIIESFASGLGCALVLIALTIGFALPIAGVVLLIRAIW